MKEQLDDLVAIVWLLKNCPWWLSAATYAAQQFPNPAQ